MYKLDHHNVLSLIGLCLDAGPSPYIILPFMENGSLRSYIKSNKTRLYTNIETEDEEVIRLETKPNNYLTGENFQL